MRVLDIPHPAFIPRPGRDDRPRLQLPIEAPRPRPQPDSGEDPGVVIIPLTEDPQENSCGITFRF